MVARLVARVAKRSGESPSVKPGVMDLDMAAIFKEPDAVRRMPSNTTELRFPVFYTVGITLISGYLDAIGFSSLHGLYISFMSGNSTRMATALAEDDLKTVWACAGVILSFVFGAFLGAVIFGVSRRSRLARLFAFETLLVGLAVALHVGGVGFPSLLPAVVAMGMQNNAQHTLNGADLGKSFVTGTLFSLGRSIADWVIGKGGAILAVEFALAWSAFFAGAVTGTLVLQRFGLVEALSISGAAILMFAVAAKRAGV